jgi:uncharacterized protein YbjT (DUF2867 family)
MILVAGGTGRLGSLVVGRLTARGERVRVLTRDASRASGLLGPQVEVVHGDVREPSTLADALTDVTTVVSAVHGFAGPGHVTPKSVDRDGNVNLIDAADQHGAEVVLLSVVGASRTSSMELFRMKAAAEEHLRASRVRWTIVRATAFVELYLELLRRSAGKHGRPMVFGRGNNPINFVSVNDVAAAVESAVLDTSMRGQILEVGGPEDLTLSQLAALSGPRSDGIEWKPRHIPRFVLRGTAATGLVIHSLAARHAAAAVVMDTQDMTFDAGPFHAAHPHLPYTTAADVARSSNPSASR